MEDIHTRAGRVALDEKGSGPPVLLLHATGHDRHDFDPILPALARNHRTISIDWPGHGESAPSSELLARGAPLLADVLEDVVEALNLPPAILIGNSVGGFAAARLAITHPDRVAGLVLVNNGGFLKMNPLSRSFCRFIGTPAVFRRTFPLFVRAYMKVRTDNDRAVLQRASSWANTAQGAEIGAALWRSFATPEHDLRDRAHLITAPTLITWGRKDVAIPLSGGRNTEASIPGAELKLLNTGHVVFSSDSEGFLDVVQPFLDSIEQRR